VKNVLAGRSQTFRVDFLNSDGPAFADAGSVEFSLVNGLGTVLVPMTVVPALSYFNKYSIPIEILAVHHSVASPKLFETRVLTVKWAVSGETYSLRELYRVIPVQLYSVVPSQIQDFLGVGSDELPESSIDLPSAYIEATAEYDISPFIGLGTIQEYRASQFLLAVAILMVLPGLQLRILQARSDGTLKASRLSTIDFEALERAARDLKASSLKALTAASESSGSGIAIAFSTQTDVITNT
jgi:hypothetical protein